MHFRTWISVSVVLFAVASLACAQQDFSADLVTTQGKDSKTGKVYSTKDKMRFESTAKEHGAGIVIINFASQTTYAVVPEQQMYIEMKPGQSMGMPNRQPWAFMRPTDLENACAAVKMSVQSTSECHKVGAETVNGRNAVKYEASNAKGESTEFWLDSKLYFPLKWREKNGNGGELQNIKEGTQPASLFEIPSGYRKMELPAGMPGMPQR